MQLILDFFDLSFYILEKSYKKKKSTISRRLECFNLNQKLKKNRKVKIQ